MYLLQIVEKNPSLYGLMVSKRTLFYDRVFRKDKIVLRTESEKHDKEKGRGTEVLTVPLYPDPD